MSYIRNVD
jgi:hypothetical protein